MLGLLFAGERIAGLPPLALPVRLRRGLIAGLLVTTALSFPIWVSALQVSLAPITCNRLAAQPGPLPLAALGRVDGLARWAVWLWPANSWAPVAGGPGVRAACGRWLRPLL